MLRSLGAPATAAVAAAGLAMGAPVTVHAANGYTGGACATDTHGHEFQSISSGANPKHSFTDSKANCVIFEGDNDTVYLNNSNDNLIILHPGANNNFVHNFNNSNNNAILFINTGGSNPTGPSGNELVASSANFNTLLFSPDAMNDFVDLLGTFNENITISGTGVYANIVDLTTGGGDTCTITSASAGNGTKGHPGTVVC